MSRKADVEDTGFKGIKKRVSDGKYMVTLDYGRQMRPNKKTGVMELKQVKTTRVVGTLKEAKALLGENSAKKRRDKVTNTTGKLYIENVIDDFKKANGERWSDSYAMQIQSESKHITRYFKNVDVHKIDTLKIEEYYDYCHKSLNLSWNTIQKHRTLLIALWKYMKKGKTKYGIIENVVLDSELRGNIERFQHVIMDAEQINAVLEYCLKHEDDKSVLLMVGLPVLTGLRRSELCGLRMRDINIRKHILDIKNARVQISTGSVEKLPKTDRERKAALPVCLERCIRISLSQQAGWLGRDIAPEDYIYRTMINCTKGYEVHPGKVSRRFKELQIRWNKHFRREGRKEIPMMRLHDLRHSFVSLCLNSGSQNPYMVSANTGHAVEDNTMTKVYWHDDGNRSEINAFIDSLITVDFDSYIRERRDAGDWREPQLHALRTADNG